MVVAKDMIRNLPRMTFRLFEDKITVADAFDAAGRKVEGNLAYSSEIKKGNFVKIYASSTTTTPVAQLAAAGDDELIGIIVDNPVRGDSITTTGTPTVAQMRKATVAVFAQAVMNLSNDGGTAITPQTILGHSGATAGQFEAGTPVVKGNGYSVALEYSTPGTNATPTFAAAMGCFGYLANTA